MRLRYFSSPGQAVHNSRLPATVVLSDPCRHVTGQAGKVGALAAADLGQKVGQHYAIEGGYNQRLQLPAHSSNPAPNAFRLEAAWPVDLASTGKPDKPHRTGWVC